MLRLTSDRKEDLARSRDDDWGDRLSLAEWRDRGGPPVALLVAGALVVGLGILAWTYLGPDLRRYAKIHSM